jgi:hypothetical protein
MKSANCAMIVRRRFLPFCGDIIAESVDRSFVGSTLNAHFKEDYLILRCVLFIYRCSQNTLRIPNEPPLRVCNACFKLKVNASPQLSDMLRSGADR